MTRTPDNGIIDKPSAHSVEQTVAKLKNILQSTGVTMFALIDHSAEAEKGEMKMASPKLLIFGNPKAGTPSMLAAPRLAIDLPLKILVWEDGDGRAWISYNSSQYLRDRHGFPRGIDEKHRWCRTLGSQGGGVAIGPEVNGAGSDEQERPMLSGRRVRITGGENSHKLDIPSVAGKPRKKGSLVRLGKFLKEAR